MQSFILKGRTAGLRAAVLAVAVWGVLESSTVQAQQPVAPPRAVVIGSAWYTYVPTRGWAYYAPASASPTGTSNTAARTAPDSPGAAGAAAVAPPARGWAGYHPATAWTGYAPASAPSRPVVRPAPRFQATPTDSRKRRAADLFVNHIAPELSWAAPAYREVGTGRRIPLAKPWLPLNP